METRFYSRLSLPGGEFTLFFSPLGLIGLTFPGFEREAALAEARPQTPDSQIVSRLTAYFKGEKVGFGEFCLDWIGASAFCRLVWQEAREIPWGKTLTYGEIARKIGTYEISILPGLCCTIVPKQPSTAAKLADVIGEEEKVDIDALVEKSLEGMYVLAPEAL